jgi:hypothetical protein
MVGWAPATQHWIRKAACLCVRRKMGRGEGKEKKKERGKIRKKKQKTGKNSKPEISEDKKIYGIGVKINYL